MTGASPSVDVVIVNWNSQDHLRGCLESLVQATRGESTLRRVVIVDNDSTDGSLDRIRESPLPLEVIENRSNRGFASGCNQGAAGSRADYILFLNPDVRLSETSLRVPLEFMQRPSSAAYAICGIQLLDGRGEISPSVARFPTWGQLLARSAALDRLFPQWVAGHYLSDAEHRMNRDVDQVSGAFFLVRRAVFEQLAGFDERFFMYYEELDLSLRARRAGYRSAFLADTHAVHYGGASSEQVLGRRLFYSLRSRILYGYKHFGPLRATLVMLGAVLIEPLARLIRAIRRGSKRELQATAYATGRLWLSVLRLSK
jgi:GT2 family glycosyltransferase